MRTLFKLCAGVDMQKGLRRSHHLLSIWSMGSDDLEILYKKLSDKSIFLNMMMS